MKTDYPCLPGLIPADNQLSSGHYVANFARDRSELEEVQRLRFEVFNLEMGEGLDESFKTRMDIDPHDDQCHHLTVRDQRNGALVGTYRMQSLQMAKAGKGFYSDNEYYLSDFPGNMLENSLELGRACIASKHRNGRVLFLLWRGLFYYLQTNKLRYMFGCCSLNSQDMMEGWALYTRLQRAGNLHPDIYVKSREGYTCEKNSPGEEEIVDMQLPRLMRLYLDYGAMICSEPAIDREFKTIDYLALFDLRDIPEKMMKVFKKDLL